MTELTMTIEGLFFGLTALAALPLLIYGWWFYFKIARHQGGWRARVSLVVLGLTTACVLLFPVAIGLAPRQHSDYNAFMAQLAVYYEGWFRVVIKVLAGCFVLSFFGKGRLIPVTAAVSVGLAWWWMSTTFT